MLKEYREKRRNANKQPTAFLRELRMFEKRSKLIKSIKSETLWGRLYIVIEINKENGKVIAEMLNFIRQTCQYEDNDNNTIYLQSYDELGINYDETVDDFDVEYNIKIYKRA